MSPTLRTAGLELCVALALAGCGKANKLAESRAIGATPVAAAVDATAAAKQRKAPGNVEAQRATLAITRSVEIEREADAVAPAFSSARAACEEETASACTVLQANLTTGATPQASLALRAAPAGIARLLAKLRSANGLVSESTQAEDLAAPLFDAERRLTMQRDYRDALAALRAKSSNDINALIRVNQELAQVQSQLEAVDGERAHLQQQIDTETLNISFTTIAGERDGSHPIARSLHEFGRNLADAAGAAITFIAWAIPWCVVLVPLVWLVLWVRRRRRAAR